MSLEDNFAQHCFDDLSLEGILWCRAGRLNGDYAGCLSGLGIRFSPHEKALHVSHTKRDGSDRAQNNGSLFNPVVARVSTLATLTMAKSMERRVRNLR